MTNRIELSGGPPKTKSVAWLTAEGDLRIEIYDFSSEAHDHLGNDIAFTIGIPSTQRKQLLERLGESSNESGSRLLELLSARFDSYYDIKRWLEEHKIPFTREFEAWA